MERAKAETYRGSPPVQDPDLTVLQLRRELAREQQDALDRERGHRKRIRELEDELATLKEKRPVNSKGAEQESYSEEIVASLLRRGSKHMDYLRAVDIGGLSAREKVASLQKLFNFLVEEKEREEEKYNKLLELHNNLIEVNSRNEEIYNPHRLLELEETNVKLRQELRGMQLDYEYLFATKRIG